MECTVFDKRVRVIVPSRALLQKAENDRALLLEFVKQIAYQPVQLDRIAADARAAIVAVERRS